MYQFFLEFNNKKSVQGGDPPCKPPYNASSLVGEENKVEGREIISSWSQL